MKKKTSSKRFFEWLGRMQAARGELRKTYKKLEELGWRESSIKHTIKATWTNSMKLLTINLLTQDQADKIIAKAWLDVIKGNLGSYRFGKCLLNRIPIECEKHLVALGIDLCYIQDTEEIIKLFNLHCVEANDEKP